MVKVPSAADADAAAVGAGGWNASLCNCASSHPTARAVSRTPGHKSGRTAEVDPGVGVRSPQILRQPLARTLPLV